MKLTGAKNWAARLVLLAGASAALPLSGCMLQATVGGQTLPSAYYLRDDVQFFPAGPEFILPNQRQALEEYRAEQDAIREGLGGAGGGPGGGPGGAPPPAP